LSLLLLAVLCITPVIMSYVIFYVAPPARHTNYGELLETRPLPDPELELAGGGPFRLSKLKGKWLLLMVDSGNCDEFCRGKLYHLRQLRLTQGMDMERIERVWLLSDDAVPAPATTHDYAGTWLIRAGGTTLLRELPAPRTPADHIYIVDPLGNLVLRYARDADPRQIVKDISRLLRTSRIG
jgi:cytochrome oxidase Cu insertion factor (SCO1/SenC/PrrC family)